LLSLFALPSPSPFSILVNTVLSEARVLYHLS